MLKKVSAFLIAITMLVGVTSCSMPQNIFSDQIGSSADDSDETLANNPYGFEFTMDSKKYNLPAQLDYFTDKGWDFDSGKDTDTAGTDDVVKEEKVDPETLVLESGAYSDYIEVYNKSKTYCIKLKFYNDTSAEANLNNCKVVGIKLDALNSSVPYTQLDGDIDFGSSYDKVIEAYGEPSFEKKISSDTGAVVSINDISFDENADGSANKQVYYYITQHSFVELTFGVMNSAADSLINIVIENDIDVEKEYDYEKDRKKTPDTIALYNAPNLLGKSISDFSFKYENNLYTLPIPVSELIDDGWEFARGASTLVRSGTTEKGVILKKNNLFIELMIHNYETDKSQTAINCYAVSISAGLTGSYANILMPKGITLGSDASELESFYTKPYLSDALSANGGVDASTVNSAADAKADEASAPSYMYEITEPVSDPLTENSKRFINKLETEDYIMYSYVMPDDLPTVTIPDKIKGVVDLNKELLGTYRKHIDIYVSKANNKVVYIYMQNCPEFVVDEAAIWAEQLAQADEERAAGE